MDSRTEPMDRTFNLSYSSPVSSPSMTQRRGIQLRIHVIPPEDPPRSDDAVGQSAVNKNTFHLSPYRIDGDNDNSWASPPASRRLSSSSDGSCGSSTQNGNSNKHFLSLPSTEFSPSYVSASKDFYYSNNRRDSSCSFSSGSGSSGTTAMSISPSNQSISSSISFYTNNSAFDGSLSPYWLSPTISRPPSGLGWRHRANTTINRPRLQRSPNRNDGADSPPTTSSESTFVDDLSSNSVQFRSTRSWTFSSGHRRQQHRLTGTSAEFDQNSLDNGTNWTRSSRSPSPHPLGYYSDSPPPPFGYQSVPVSSGRRTGLSTSQLLHSKMDTGDHSNLFTPSSTNFGQRSHVGGSGGNGRRFSASIHHPHLPLAQQLHHSHLLAQQSLFVPGIVGVPDSHRRRDSASTVVFPILPSGGVWDMTTSSYSGNLLRFRRSKLGRSCPQLSSMGQSSALTNASSASPNSQIQYRVPPGAATKLRREISVHRRNSHRMGRRSFNATSPIIIAPANGSVTNVCQHCRSTAAQANSHLNADVSLGRPCQHQIHQQAANGTQQRRNSLRVQYQDLRRWSITSLPSSGYGTPGSSVVSSRYSSQERIAAEMDDSRYQRFDSGDSNSGFYGPTDVHRLGVNDSVQSGRVRSRSLSNAALSEDNIEITLRNNVYKDRFPKAKQQMEEKLESFLSANSIVSSSETNSGYKPINLNSSFSEPFGASGSGSGTMLMVPSDSGSRRTSLTPPVVATDDESLKVLSDGSARFIHHQIMELAADCLQKSRSDLLSSAYFYELSQNLEDFLEEAKEKSTAEAVEQLSGLVKKLHIIVSRPARLLECLEFNPEEFYHMLHEAESQAKEAQRRGLGIDVPQYIVRQLGLTKSGPLQDINDNLSQSVDSGNATDSPIHAGVTAANNLSSPNISRRRSPPKESDFEIIKLVSNGAYGAVYLVRHRETHRRFALKKLNKSNLMLRNEIDKVYAERDIMTFTDNPFVVSFYGSFETKKHLCMVMEYVEGGDCATLLKNIGVFPVEMARLYVAETILAIEYLHSYGIVHRDLKPDNLLITALGHIKLTDFGLSKIGLMNRTNLLYEGYFDALMTETTQFQDMQICGTPEYIAPEVILRQGYGKPVDWWALGVILYELLVGTVPFFGETPEELFSHVISDEIEWPEEPDAPPADAQDLVTGLLQQNPLQRLGTLNGATELKEHPFFAPLDWNSLLRQKAEFIPQLEGEDDTSYFDTRSDRYQHDLDSGEDDSGDVEIESVNTNINGQGERNSPSPFASFSSSSARYSLLTQETAMSGDNFENLTHRKSPSIVTPNTASSSNLLTIHVSPVPHESTSNNSSGAHDQYDQSTMFLPPPGRQVRAASQPENILQISNNDGGRVRSDVNLAPSFDRSISVASVSPREFSDAVSNEIVVPRQSSTSRKSFGAFPENLEAQSNFISKQEGTHSKLSKPFSSINEPKSSSNLRSIAVTTQRKQYSDALRIMIPSDDSADTLPGSPTLSSCGSSREGSPANANIRRRSSTNLNSIGRQSTTHSSQERKPVVNQLKPPIVIRRGHKGFGITVRAIRVYVGETDYYTIQHLITAVEAASPAYDAGLRPNDLLTHVNGESIQNMTHTEVVRKLMASSDAITLRVSPLESTSIRQDGPPRRSIGKLIKKGGSKQKMQKRRPETDGKRRGSIFRRKRDSLDGAMLTVKSPHVGSAAGGGPNLAQLAALQRSISNTDGPLLNAPTLKVHGERIGGRRSPRNSISIGVRRGSNCSRNNDSCSSVESGSIPESAAESAVNEPVSPRPSSLQGLRNKMELLCSSVKKRQPPQLSPLAYSKPMQNDTSIASSSASGLSPGINIICHSTPSMNPVTLMPVVHKKQILKSKKSDNSLLNEKLEKPPPPVHRNISPGSRSLPIRAPRFDSSGSTSSNTSIDVIPKNTPK